MKKVKKIFSGSSFPLLALVGWNPGNVEGFGLPNAPIYFILRGVLFWILAIFGIIAVIGFVISGIMYIISSGNDDMMEKAKNAMVYSIVGVVVGLAGLVIIYAIDLALRGNGYFY